MKRAVSRIAALSVAAAMSFAASGLAIAYEPSLKGMIVSRDGSTMVVRSAAGDVPVQLTDTTKIRGTEGVLGVRGEDHPATDLIRGLAVEVTTVEGDSGVTASEVTFKSSDLKTARQISAGIAQTEAQVAENSGRIDNVGALEAAGRTKVFFAVGSSTISDEGKQELQAIAAKAKGLGVPFRLAVVGRADPSGNAAANQRLSEARAKAVTNYLMESAGVSPGDFLPAAGLGSNPVAQDPDAPKTAAEARRVTVTIAISKSSRAAAK